MEKKKQNKLFSVILSAVIIIVAAFAAIKMITQLKPEISVDGAILGIGMTVQELTEAGFSVGIKMSGNGGLNLDAQPQVPAQKYITDTFYLYKDGEYTNVSFRVYNNKKNSCDFKDSRVFSYSFNSRFNFSETKVLVNGIDVGGMDKEDALNAFEELGVKFDNAEKEEILSGEFGFIIGKSGEYSFELETDDAKKAIESITVKRRV